MCLVMGKDKTVLTELSMPEGYYDRVFEFIIESWLYDGLNQPVITRR